MPRLPQHRRAVIPAPWAAAAGLCLALLVPATAQAADAAAPALPLRAQDVAVLAASCANCHGPDGRGVGAIAPLRGKPQAYLLQRLQAFKAGTAADATVMTRLARGYDDAQLQALAQWFSQEKP